MPNFKPYPKAKVMKRNDRKKARNRIYLENKHRTAAYRKRGDQ